MMLSQEHSTLLWVTVAVAAARLKGKGKRLNEEDVQKAWTSSLKIDTINRLEQLLFLNWRSV